ncbi:MAG: hypothetical protein M1834_008206 [Cirrosporium novae-zelandiae]|nr:MAG: hypothetical protein M1834_008206 [Cirrosporium novae-zelandiae]
MANLSLSLKISGNFFKKAEAWAGSLEGPATTAYWIDAICINQGDTEERNAQVRLMKDIYIRSELVLIWLGEESSNSTDGIELISALCRAHRNGKISLNGQQILKEEFVPAGLPDPKVPKWKALDALYWRPWFTRIWVIQEIAVARSAIFLCGDYAIPSGDLILSAQILDNRGVGILTGTEPREVTNMALAINAFHFYKWDLSSYLVSARSSESTDPRDKIYGILGLAIDKDNTAFDPDYSKLVATIYRDVAVACIQKAKSLDILNSVQDPLISLLASNSAPPERGAAGNSEATVSFSKDHKILYARGVAMDETRAVGCGNWPKNFDNIYSLTSSSFHESKLTTLKERRWRQWENMASKLGTYYYPTGQDVQEVFQRTVIFDAPVNTNENDNPLPLKELYRAFHCQWRRDRHFDGGDDKSLLDKNPVAGAYAKAVNLATSSRAFFITRKGYMGLGSLSTCLGDFVTVLYGGKTPFVLRRRGGKHYYTFAGERYVHGLMNGEGLKKMGEDPEVDDSNVQEFAIL